MTTTISGPELSEKRRQHEKFIARARAQGQRVLSFACPYTTCAKPIDTVAPAEGETWDTLSSCPSCGGLFMKIVHHDRVDALVPPAEKDKP